MILDDAYGIESWESDWFDREQECFCGVVLKENNIFGLPPKPENLPNYYSITYYGDGFNVKDVEECDGIDYNIKKFILERE